MNKDYDKAVDTLMKDVKDLRADMKSVIAALRKEAGDCVDSAKESVHDSVAERVEQLRDAADDIGRRCHDGVKSCTAQIEQHPFASLLAAVGVGVVLGGLLKCHRR
jgi:ElaB/YqjD/DUF883 family membrane-anchored ribosome-binding protein